MPRFLFIGLFILLTAFPQALMAQADFRVLPYLQNPAPNAISIVWFSNANLPGLLTYAKSNESETTRTSTPVLADALAYSPWESDTFFSGQAPAPPYRHQLRLTGLETGTTYHYSVEQGASRFSASFKTAPAADRPIRFIVYADSETEPESTGQPVQWSDPTGQDPDRVYLLDQTLGYANNLAVINARNPDFIVIAGDLVESGGEQRDWDEFWRHNTHSDETLSLAGRVPLLAAPGNHEYYEGPFLDEYNQPGSERAINKFRTYFDFPANGSPDPDQEKRYYRLDYGPITLIALDVANDSPHRSDRDTNFYLLGENDPGGGHAPSFHPGSRQYAWLEEQLRDAQIRSRFTFVTFHHAPYSVGPHGWSPGEEAGFDDQSGVPVRTLTPLFMRYGVDAIFAGHDEMWERSELTGQEIGADSVARDHTIHFYDVGIGGDGLRGSQEGLMNSYQKFLVHNDVPEIWDGNRLVDGGKHYGHLEVEVTPLSADSWQAKLTPIYVFPVFDASGTTYLGYERRVYPDSVILISKSLSTAVDIKESGLPASFKLYEPHPNPFDRLVSLRYALPEQAEVEVTIYNLLGQPVRHLVEQATPAGKHHVAWNGEDDIGAALPAGIYLVFLRAGKFRGTARAVLLR
jgi:3',5'-cyclic AMP phosphodiesterase CpdA